MKTESENIKKYFSEIDEKLKKAFKIATEARKKAYDPVEKVDIYLAKNMAERVEGLIKEMAPQLVGTKMIDRIHEYEKKYKLQDWRVAFKITEDVATEKFCKFKTKLKAMEMGVRVGFAYITGGIVSAPLEGFVGLKIKKRYDNKEYLSAWYAGPVRGAGGTAAAASVLLIDFIRKKMGYSEYDPTEEEISRYATEILDYHDRITNLQYLPSEKEIKFLIKHTPIEINGDPTEDIEVFNYKKLPRVETDRIRGGMCLVVAEGIAQKAKKIRKRIESFEDEFDVGWGFLNEFISLQETIKAKEKKPEETKKITPNYTYISDLVAGRPVLTYPLRGGGFRLRYGRSRISGYSSSSIHPATMLLLNKYLATGTQLKIERPGKATAITPCDTIEGPIIKLNNGSVVKIENEAEAKNYLNNIQEFLFLGDILISYGDFSENGHVLVPCGYNEEWYVREIEKTSVNFFGTLDFDKLSDFVEISEEKIRLLINNPTKVRISARAALNISDKLKIPLHPYYTYYWNLITHKDLVVLLKWFVSMKQEFQDGQLIKIILPLEKEPKNVLENIGLPHTVVANEFVVIDKNHSLILLKCLNATNKENVEKNILFIEGNKEKSVLDIINNLSKIKLRDKSGTFIGARMGRPEKAKMRKMTGNPHTLFPVGDEGGRMRSVQSALETNKVTADFPTYKCTKCNKETIYPICEVCGKKTKKTYYCKVCGLIENNVCGIHGQTTTFRNKELDINHFFNAALKKLNMKTYPDLIKGVKGTSNKDHIPENIAKGILRAKHDIFVNKDGTTRYDMTELPLTYFKPLEINTTIEKLKEMGYQKDINGMEITDAKQILELKPQDLILPSCPDSPDESSDNVLFRIANFIDNLLKDFYNIKPFYNLDKKEDIVGCLVIGLAPHISAGMIGRVIGFSHTQACFAHPLWHASLRRDCDGDECCVILLMDALLNFSRQYLPDRRGTKTMDSPLVLTSKLIPSEVDDMVHGMDVVKEYPLEFYEAALQYKYPWDIEIEQLNDRLNTPQQYENINFTHNVSNINMGVLCSAYKTLPSMVEKLKGQMELARKIRAVDEMDVARLVIEKHFLKDIRGNLRKFSQQQFRCVNCNEKFRRPPLIGKCTKCSGRVIFTVSEGSVIKYLKESINLAEQFDVPAYLKQTLELTKRMTESVFGKEKEKQVGLTSFT